MHMEITSKNKDNAVVVYVDGDLTTNSSPEAEALINEILEGTESHVIINVEKVSFIASTGLRIILVLGKRLKGDDLKLIMCSMNDTTKSVFKISGFSKLFPVFETEAEALDSL